MKTRLLLTLVLFVAACTGRRATAGDGGLEPDGGSGTDGGMHVADSSMPGTDAGPPSGYVDPSCLDGMYTETFPDNTASLSGISFTGDIPGFVHAVLARRYTFGDSQVAGGEMNTSFPMDCAVAFAGSPTTAADLYGQLDVIVHECGHLQDGRMSSGPTNAYVINPTLTEMCMRGDATDRGGDTYARSRLNSDTYSHLRPPCPGSSPAPGCDFYANTYLDGNPDDTTFQGGDQGFNMLLEEAVQYINSLVTGYAFEDQLSGGTHTSDRDGILTMLWYVERYLHYAHTNYPTAYMRLSTDSCWRDAILTVWGRAWLYLERTRGMSLGIDDATIEGLVMDPTLLGEIQAIRTLSGCS